MSSPAEPGPSSRKRKGRPLADQVPVSSARSQAHTSRACDACRRRKTRCDGLQPSCSACSVYEEPCTYNITRDRRRRAAKSYVTALEERVAYLQRLVQKYGISENSPPGNEQDSTLSPPLDPVPGRITGISARDDEGEPDQRSIAERLKVDESTGELLEYGPTSAYKHLPDPQSNTSPRVKLVSSLLFPDTERNDQTIAASINQAVSDLDMRTHDDCLRLFFRFFNPWGWLVDEFNFRHDLESATRWPHQVQLGHYTPHYGPLLHYAILAIGVMYTDMPLAERQRAARSLARNGQNSLEDEVRAGKLSAVTGLVLLASHYWGQADQGVGYVYVGMGLRLNRMMGLGIDCTAWVNKGIVSEKLKQSRNRVFFSSFIQDQLWSTYVGRTPSQNLIHHSTPIPEPDESIDAQTWGLDNTLHGEPGSSSGDVRCWISSAFSWTSRLAAIVDAVLIRVYSSGTNVNSEGVQNTISRLNVLLEKWYHDLPGPLRVTCGSPPSQAIEAPLPHIMVLNAMYHFSVILLHRPISSSTAIESADSSVHNYSTSRCIQAAAQIVEIVELFAHSPGLRYAPISLAQVIFTAGSINIYYGVISRARPRKRDEDALRATDACIRGLDEMSQTWPGASESGAILSRLLHEWHTSENRRIGPSKTLVSLPNSETEMHTLLENNPALEAQLRRLGWQPPTTSATPFAIPNLPGPAEPSADWFSTLEGLGSLAAHPPERSTSTNVLDFHPDATTQSASADDPFSLLNFFDFDNSNVFAPGPRLEDPIQVGQGLWWHTMFPNDGGAP